MKIKSQTKCVSWYYFVELVISYKKSKRFDLHLTSDCLTLWNVVNKRTGLASWAQQVGALVASFAQESGEGNIADASTTGTSAWDTGTSIEAWVSGTECDNSWGGCGCCGCDWTRGCWGNSSWLRGDCCNY